MGPLWTLCWLYPSKALGWDSADTWALFLSAVTKDIFFAILSCFPSFLLPPPPYFLLLSPLLFLLQQFCLLRQGFLV